MNTHDSENTNETVSRILFHCGCWMARLNRILFSIVYVSMNMSMSMCQSEWVCAYIVVYMQKYSRNKKPQHIQTRMRRKRMNMKQKKKTRIFLFVVFDLLLPSRTWSLFSRSPQITSFFLVRSNWVAVLAASTQCIPFFAESTCVYVYHSPSLYGSNKVLV